MVEKRTDLALEARELWQESAQKATFLSGVRARTTKEEGCAVTKVEILNDRGAEALGKPKGRYLTVDLSPCLQQRDFERCVRLIGRHLRHMLPRQGSILVAGLGNAAMTPDAVGPLALKHLLVTRHLIASLPEQFGSFRDVSALAPGVLGSTGVESAEAIRSFVSHLSPAAVIAVDALASRRMERLCATVQISSSGIVPGSGVGNHRHPLNHETLGIPVIALGVPTVVDAATIAADLLAENGVTDIDPSRLSGGSGVFVTPRDIDERVREVGKILGYSINWAAQRLEIDEITALLA